MSRIFQVALREFLATVATKGFIIGVLVTPLMLAIVIFAMRLIDDEAPRVEGQVAIVDPTGHVAGPLSTYLEPEAIAARRGDLQRRATENLPDAAKALTDTPRAQEALEAALGEVPQIETVDLGGSADLEAEKTPLRTGNRLALVVIDGNAIVPGDDGEFGSYSMFVREKLDDRVEDEIRAGLRDTIVEARVAERGLDRAEIEKLTRVKRTASTTVTEGGGERKTNEVLNMLLPAGFMVLLLVSVFSGGQYILTTTVEEKSSRVVEVILSAVSPMELMAGKILGQFVVGLVILALYAGMGFVGLFSFALLGFVDLYLIPFLLVFYLIAYFTMASLMAAIGSAVNEMREAQTLMTPVIVLMMIPWLLWLPISRNPDSTLSVVLTFVPPINAFVTLLRMASTSPPPMWQVAAAIVIGLAGAWAAVWFAAKVFRIGLLMYGKPPNFATLVRWVRMA